MYYNTPMLIKLYIITISGLMPNDCVTVVIKRLIYMLDLILLMESHRTERDWSTSTKDNISFT